VARRRRRVVAVLHVSRVARDFLRVVVALDENRALLAAPLALGGGCIFK